MRRHRGAIALALAALSGCLGAADLPEPLHPATHGAPWSAPSSELWVVMSAGCGFCSGSPDVAEFHLVALYRGGEVLAADYALDRGAGAGVSFASDGPRAYAEVVGRIAARSDLYGEYREDLGESTPIRFHAVRTGTLVGTERDGALATVRAGLEAAREPREARERDCDDCAAVFLQAFGAPREAWVKDARDRDVGKGWRTVEDQMAALGAWLPA